jgi:hypothetical protein
MPVTAGPIYPGVKKGLVFAIDPARKDSYPGSGATVVDLVNGNTTTASSSPTFNSNGYWEFNTPSDDFIFSTNPLYENSITSFTLSTWINVTLSDHNGGVGIMAATSPGADPSGGGFWIGYDDRNATHSPVEGIAWNCKTASGFQRGKSNNNAISNNTWHNVTLVLDNQVTLYIDGVSSTNRTQDSSGNYSTVNNEFSIGSIDDSNYDYIGSLSTVILYNRALSASEVTQNYNRLKGRFGLS